MNITALYLLPSRLALELYLFNDKMKWQLLSYSEVGGGDSTGQETLWILGGEHDCSLSVLCHLPLRNLTHLCTASQSPQALRGAHCPDPILTPSSSFHPLALKHTDLCYHSCLSPLEQCQFLQVPCLLQLPPNFQLPGPSAGFSHSSIKLSPYLLPGYFLPCVRHGFAVTRMFNRAYFGHCC